jgi:hypothetical protein
MHGERIYRSMFPWPLHQLEVSSQLHALAILPFRGKSPRYPLYRRLRGPQGRPGRRGEEEIYTLQNEYNIMHINSLPTHGPKFANTNFHEHAPAVDCRHRLNTFAFRNIPTLSF